MSITRDLFAARSDDFEQVLELDYSGPPLPLVGADISMQVRLYAGQVGTPLAEIPAVEFLDALSSGSASWRTLSVYPRIPKETLEAFPTGLNLPEVGEADRYAYEIKIQYVDGKRDSVWTGAFILEPGVNKL
ncbi:hypothetical protein [Sphingobium sp. Cam5-1]|uniref:hypothetical protein n=1 Tax=Sphingobium sp. Cam5-1 TaxID=2789327 RepID=UPI0018AD1F2D|nr:hypothetical protein [Sphingobium sp. Cam5-1]QPI73940.1 hypothetical protein IZV00_05605 [Sphingobium sp. Cam5-1]